MILSDPCAMPARVTVVSRYLTFIENSKSSGSLGWSIYHTRVLANRGPAKTVMMGAR